jgi:oligoribonuclease
MADKHFFWLDLEMSGLYPDLDKILEAAVVITDKQLSSVFTFETTVFQPPEVLENMNDWCKEHHAKSGLTNRVPSGIPENELDKKLCEIVDTYFKDESVILCGNSIAHDRKFVEAYLPTYTAKLHYRMLDVSSFKIVFQEIYGKRYAKKNSHRALDDINESIEELKYYLNCIDNKIN